MPAPWLVALTVTVTVVAVIWVHIDDARSERQANDTTDLINGPTFNKNTENKP